ncbi:MAG: hypothetical protein FWH36_02590 [Lentimicrobiaceae bacterium]|nr:hypothetical protein [Lentimicrobiaceae bacterium]
MDKNIFYFVVFALLLSANTYAQKHTIFLEDTMYYTTPDWRFMPYFNDSLADGLWILHNLYRNDSNKISEQTILLTGIYKDYKREGTFNRYGYYYIFPCRIGIRKAYKQYYIWSSETYKSGLLDGMVIDKANNATTREVTYEKGKKNGLDIRYVFVGECLGRLCQINYYSHDTLISRNYYGGNSILWCTIIRLDNGEYMQVEYDTTGQKKYVLYYDVHYTMYKWQKYYPHQLIEKEKEGCFLVPPLKEMLKKADDYDEDCFCDAPKYDWLGSIPMIKGIERLYNQDGVLIEEKEAEDEIEEIDTRHGIPPCK